MGRPTHRTILGRVCRAAHEAIDPPCGGAIEKVIRNARRAAALGLLAILPAALAWVDAGAADIDELADLAARVQYAVYSEDARWLAETRRELAELRLRGGLVPLGHYQHAYAGYRLAELAPDEGGGLEVCIEQAERALDEDQGFADAKALLGACHALEAHRDLVPSPLSTRRAARHLGEALELAPDNPRVLLLAAVSVAREPGLGKTLGVEPGVLLMEAERQFRTPLAVPAGYPDWGEAEVKLRRAEAHLAAGRRVAARNALEEALLLAPDYRRARTLKARLRGGASGT